MRYEQSLGEHFDGPDEVNLFSATIAYVCDPSENRIVPFSTIFGNSMTEQG